MEASIREIPVFSDYCGIDFIRYYEGRGYCIDDYDTGEISDTVFCLCDENYTLENIKTHVESHIEEIFDKNYNNADDSYFNLYIPIPGTMYSSIRHSSVEEILTMIGGESYYNEMCERYEKMMFRQNYLYGRSLEDLESMMDCCCESHKAIIQEYCDELKAKIE